MPARSNTLRKKKKKKNSRMTSNVKIENNTIQYFIYPRSVKELVERLQLSKFEKKN